jgi:hypothetical protein
MSAPYLVLIDTTNNFYVRFKGKTRLLTTKAPGGPLTPDEVEQFRTNPDILLGSPEPESA